MPCLALASGPILHALQDRDARLHTLEANTSHLARSCGALERDKVRLQKEVAKLKLMLSVKDYGSDSCA